MTNLRRQRLWSTFSVFFLISLLKTGEPCVGIRKNAIDKDCTSCDQSQVEKRRGNFRDKIIPWIKAQSPDKNGCLRLKVTCNAPHYDRHAFAYMEFQDELPGPSEGAKIIEVDLTCKKGSWMYSDRKRTFEVKKVICNIEGTLFGDPTCATCEPSDLVLSGKTSESTPKFRNYKEDGHYCKTLTVFCPKTDKDKISFMMFNQGEHVLHSLGSKRPQLSARLTCKNHKWYLAKDTTFGEIKEISCHAGV